MNVILICGLNGSGKTTLGKKLAEKLDFKFLNDEDYYFIESDMAFSKSRTDEEIKEFIISYIKRHKNVVITATQGDLGNEINSMYSCIIYLFAPLEVRISRIKKREFDRFGKRVLKGGDMYLQQKKFYDFVILRTAEKIEKCLDTFLCKVMKLDGTKLIEDNIDFIKSNLSMIK